MNFFILHILAFHRCHCLHTTFHIFHKLSFHIFGIFNFMQRLIIYYQLQIIAIIFTVAEMAGLVGMKSRNRKMAGSTAWPTQTWGSANNIKIQEKSVCLRFREIQSQSHMENRQETHSACNCKTEHTYAEKLLPREKKDAKSKRAGVLSKRQKRETMLKHFNFHRCCLGELPSSRLQ